MKFRKLALAASAVSLAVTPIAAQAVVSEREIAPVEADSELGGGASLIVVLALVALGIGIFAADSDPISV